MVRFFLVFNFVLQGLRWVGVPITRLEPYLGFLLRVNVVDAVNGLNFFAVPYAVSASQMTSAHACKNTGCVHGLTGSGRAAGRNWPGRTNLCVSRHVR